MSNPLEATDPLTSATVSASAGTGKTWLLVTRLIRLLLSGARPDGILAVTFTRKAATEMQTRLSERLLEMASCTEEELIDLLTDINVAADTDTIRRARSLYETLLNSPYTIRTSTFHSFCQDILRKFPMEAGIAPGFELQETTEDLKKSAWNAICAKASTDPDGKLAQDLETLIDACDGLSNTESAIDSFLEHRSDWWAFTDGQKDHSEFAISTLSSQLNISADINPYEDFFTETILNELGVFISLLEKHPGKNNDEYRDSLLIAKDSSRDNQERFQETIKVFFTTTGTPRARKENATQGRKMGEAGQQRFLEIHNKLCDAIQETQDKINTREAFLRISTWYRVGSEVLNHYQKLKKELRVLDFSDLEWLTYLLLNHSNNVHWIQYKLDQRIDHLLIDEFQDTNPTQWRLILPLLEELAAGENERQRSVFLVGDDKQSIYRFRRADPELFDTAQSWLRKHLQAVSQPLDVSWRSAEAIMTFVNRVFGTGALKERLPHFTEHTTHHLDLWGRVEILPLVEQSENNNDDTETITTPEFRNPLKSPLLLNSFRDHLEEGRFIASRITELVANNTLVGKAEKCRPIRYSDIIILVRKRTNVADYEQALREAGIPYTGADRGALLNSLEIRDMVNLLELLIAPFNDLALVNVLRSPIFGCSNDELILIAQQKETGWFHKLSTLASQHVFSNHKSPLKNVVRAYQLLSQWREQVGILPVHDLLDRIYCEGNIINRYQAGSPSYLQHSVTANLTRFIELALEVDSGRHPTIGRFVSRLHNLRQHDKEAPDEGSPIQADSRVRIMTIHASKGLEAPAVFLADAAFSSSDKNAYKAIVDWPADKDRPDCFLLAGRKDSRDPYTSSVLDRHALAEAREDANLLYVALTRAKQLLFISGCKPKRSNSLGWYGHIWEQCYGQCYDKTAGADLVFESSSQPLAGAPGIASSSKAFPEIDPKLQHPLARENKEFIIAPSYQTDTLNEVSRYSGEIEPEFLREEARTRGIAVHRCLQLLCEKQFTADDSNELINHLGGELGIDNQENALVSFVDEALNVYTHPGLTQLFDPAGYDSAFNEVPVQYFINGQMVYGIIDRLVVSGSEAWVIDYKTHRVPGRQQVNSLTKQYRSQIEHYCLGINKLWPGKIIRGYILLTHEQELLDLGIEYRDSLTDQAQ
ncbi:UvrD-helicase domain-containing protein [Kaarinaea lacus]